MDGKRGHITLKNPQKPGEAPKEFTFDAIYDWKYVHHKMLGQIMTQD